MNNTGTHTVVEAFLEHNNKFLMMRRSKERKVYPDVWTAIGGGAKLEEMFYPRTACLREITEETSILPDEITGLSLRYLIVVNINTNIRNHFVYFGKSKTIDFIDTDEGTLHWVDKDDLLNLKLTPYFKSLIQHYLTEAQYDNFIYLGTIDEHNNLVFNIFNIYNG